MEKYSVCSPEKLRNLCIENGWFTCGDYSQYEKLFYANEHGFSLEEIAIILWLCSDDCLLSNILNVLKSVSD